MAHVIFCLTHVWRVCWSRASLIFGCYFLVLWFFFCNVQDVWLNCLRRMSALQTSSWRHVTSWDPRLALERVCVKCLSAVWVITRYRVFSQTVQICCFLMFCPLEWSINFRFSICLHIFLYKYHVPNEQLLCFPDISTFFYCFENSWYVVNLKLVSRVWRRRQTLGIGNEIVSAIRQWQYPRIHRRSLARPRLCTVHLVVYFDNRWKNHD